MSRITFFSIYRFFLSFDCSCYLSHKQLLTRQRRNLLCVPPTFRFLIATFHFTRPCFLSLLLWYLLLSCHRLLAPNRSSASLHFLRTPDFPYLLWGCGSFLQMHKIQVLLFVSWRGPFTSTIRYYSSTNTVPSLITFWVQRPQHWLEGLFEFKWSFRKETGGIHWFIDFSEPRQLKALV